MTPATTSETTPPRAVDVDVDVLAYYFPQYHQDPRNDQLFGPGWTEWDVLRKATAHFPGHTPNNWPSAGAQDESQPDVALAKAKMAAAHGIDGFIVDWYWYAGTPFLNGFLDRGLRPALDEVPDFKFALMWANHPWNDLYPAPRNRPQRVLFAPPTRREEFEDGSQHLIDTYLGHPNYWRLDGRPYFSIYDVSSLITGLGGLDNTRRALDGLRQRARAAGHDLHLNLVASRFLQGGFDTLALLGADSTTHYTWWHHDDHGFTEFPTSSYASVLDKARAAWSLAAVHPLPYLPNVTVGWDPSPRTEPWSHDHDRGYPYTSLLAGRTTQLLSRAVSDAIDTATGEGAIAAVLINAWNEWTEGSYLEPDTTDGMANLTAVLDARTRGTAKPSAPATVVGTSSAPATNFDHETQL